MQSALAGKPSCEENPAELLNPAPSKVPRAGCQDLSVLLSRSKSLRSLLLGGRSFSQRALLSQKAQLLQGMTLNTQFKKGPKLGLALLPLPLSWPAHDSPFSLPPPGHEKYQAAKPAQVAAGKQEQKLHLNPSWPD